MDNDKTPDERKRKQLENLARARQIANEKREKLKLENSSNNNVLEVKKPKRPSNLSKIVRQILDDDELVDKVISNQPEYWGRLPAKNGGYIIATVMMVKAMSGDIKAAEWIRKTGFGDKVLLETDNGFFSKSEFTIKVLPTKHIDDDINVEEVIDSGIKQIDG